MKFKKFDKSQRSTFSYWFNHWKAYNYTALKLRHWRFRYLFHDIEKPWLRLLFNGDYQKVQEVHRKNSRHHLEYTDQCRRRWDDMVIDWECSSLTKTAHRHTALEEADMKYRNDEMTPIEYTSFVDTFKKLGLER